MIQTTRIRIYLALTLLTLACGGLLLLRRYEDARTLRLRIGDVRMLTATFLETQSISNMQELIAAAGVKGRVLQNPIPADSSRPCYRFAMDVAITATNLVIFPQAPLIEETNVRDVSRRVKSLCDGSVVIENVAPSTRVSDK
jgi:hypothetical protein